MDRLTPAQQAGGIAVLVFLEDLFAASTREQWNRVDILDMLEVTGESSLFEPGLMAIGKDASRR